MSELNDQLCNMYSTQGGSQLCSELGAYSLVDWNWLVDRIFLEKCDDQCVQCSVCGRFSQNRL